MIIGVFTNDLEAASTKGNVVKVYSLWKGCAAKHYIRSASFGSTIISLATSLLPIGTNQ